MIRSAQGSPPLNASEDMHDGASEKQLQQEENKNICHAHNWAPSGIDSMSQVIQTQISSHYFSYYSFVSSSRVVKDFECSLNAVSFTAAGTDKNVCPSILMGPLSCYHAQIVLTCSQWLCVTVVS